MRDEDKTKDQLILELNEMRGRYDAAAAAAERKNTAEEFLKYKARFREIFDHMTDCAVLYEAVGDGEDFVCKDFNIAAERMEGFTTGEVSGRSVLDVFPGVRECGLFGVLQRVWKTGKPERHPRKLHGDDGTGGWKEEFVYKSSADELVVLYRHAADGKRAEEDLRESERRYRTLFENNHIVMLLIDPETADIMDANPQACAFYGYRREELLGLRITDINVLPPEEVRAEMARALSEGRSYFNFRHRLANGDIRDVEVHSGPISVGGRRLLYSLVHDETERRRTEEQLRESEARYRTIFETTGTAMLISDENSIISFVNTEFERLSGYSKGETERRKSWTEFFTAEDLVRMREWHRLRKIDPKAAPRNYEARFVDREGRNRNVFLTIAMIPGTKRTVASLLDITRRKRMEEELLKVRKLESIGILAGGIAHDFNNLLGVILGYLNLASMNLPGGHPLLRLLNKAERASIQAKDLTQRFIVLATGGNSVKVRTSISEMMAETILEVLNDPTLEAAIQFPPDLFEIEVDQERMGQAIRNVIVNAREAMPQGGTLRIKARNIEVTDDGKRLGLPIRNGRYVKMSIKDSGIGIPEDDMGRIFDPYFSTKDRGSVKGMGLGLATTHSVISRHGGLVSVKSGERDGTAVYIYIPASE